MGSIEVYETLSERNCIMRFCSENVHCVAKGYFGLGALDQDKKNSMKTR